LDDVIGLFGVVMFGFVLVFFLGGACTWRRGGHTDIWQEGGIICCVCHTHTRTCHWRGDHGEILCDGIGCGYGSGGGCSVVSRCWSGNYGTVVTNNTTWMYLNNLTHWGDGHFMYCQQFEKELWGLMVFGLWIYGVSMWSEGGEWWLHTSVTQHYSTLQIIWLSTMTSSKYGIVKFNGEGYNIWRKRLDAILLEKDLEEVIGVERNAWVGKNLVRKVMETGGKYKEEDLKSILGEDYDNKQRRALGFINMCVSDSILLRIMAAKTGTEALKTLDDEFKKQGGINVMALLHKVARMDMEEGGDLEQYITEQDECLQLLSAHGHVVVELEQALFLLIGLPDSWATFRSNLYVKHGDTALTAAAVKGAMRTEAMSRKMMKERDGKVAGETALMAKREQPLNNDRCGKCGRWGHSKDNCTTMCFMCKEMGHTARFCNQRGGGSVQMGGYNQPIAM
jgi:gag-polypeptide of LTR copia-type